jgi:hypothetical protein
MQLINRADLLFSVEEMIKLHSSLPAFYPESPTPSSLIFGDQPELDSHTSVTEYLAEFSDPLLNYRLLLASTAGHWTTLTFQLPHGIAEILYLFEGAMTTWLQIMQKEVKENRRRQIVLVRSFLAGHENCHQARGPLERPVLLIKGQYNWSSIGMFNERESSTRSTEIEVAFSDFLSSWGEQSSRQS